MKVKTQPSQRAGMTLMETLVVLGLIGVAIAFVARTFWPFMATVRRGLARVEMQQQGLVALNKIRDRMQSSAIEGIAYRSSNPVTISVNRLLVGSAGEITDATGNLRWRTDLDVFAWDNQDQRLIARVWPPASGSDPLSLTGQNINSPLHPKKPDSADLTTLGSNRQTGTTLASGVTDLSIVNAGPGGELRLPIQMRIRLQRDADKVEVLRTLFLAGVQ